MYDIPRAGSSIAVSKSPLQTTLIALGGNVGNVPESIRTAVRRIERTEGCTSPRLSRLFRTAAVGADAGTPFVNAAMALETSLSPQRLLERLHGIEEILGRVRTVHWGPRVIDLDLVGVGKLIVSTPQLNLPHPHCWYRRFVLDPLIDVAPDWRHPVLGKTVAELRERLLPRPLPVCLQSVPCNAVSAIKNRYGGLVDAFSAGGEPDGRPRLSIGTSEPSIFSMVLDARDVAEMAMQMLQAALDAPEPLMRTESLGDGETE